MRAASLDQDQVEALALALGRALEPGDVVLLRGSMGAGKTTFTRALARGLDLDAPGRVCSPTYTIGVRHPGRLPLMHVDLFRLQDDFGGPAAGAAFESLGLEHEELESPEQVLVVEWSELWSDPPDDVVVVELTSVEGNPHLRRVDVRGTGPRGEQLARALREPVIGNHE